VRKPGNALRTMKKTDSERAGTGARPYRSPLARGRGLKLFGLRWKTAVLTPTILSPVEAEGKKRTFLPPSRGAGDFMPSRG
jgi:hypothetical protein